MIESTEALIKRLEELDRKIFRREAMERAQGSGVTTPIADIDYQNYHNACRNAIPRLLEEVKRLKEKNKIQVPSVWCPRCEEKDAALKDAIELEKQSRENACMWSELHAEKEAALRVLQTKLGWVEKNMENFRDAGIKHERAVCELMKGLKQIQGACGLPDAADGCRTALKIAKQLLEK